MSDVDKFEKIMTRYMLIAIVYQVWKVDGTFGFMIPMVIGSILALLHVWADRRDQRQRQM